MIKLLFVAVTLVSFVLYRAEKINPRDLGKDLEFNFVQAKKNLPVNDSTAVAIKSVLTKPGHASGPYNSWTSIPSIIY